MQLRLQAIDDIHLFSVPLFYEDGNSLDAIKRQEKELNINSSDYSDTEDPKRNSEGELHPLLSNFSVDDIYFLLLLQTQRPSQRQPFPCTLRRRWLWPWW